MNWYTRFRRWVSPSSIPPQYLDARRGFCLGYDLDGVPVFDSRASSMLVVGPCGSGKTTSIVAPTLRTWQGPVLALDIHGELHESTCAERLGRGRVEVLHPGQKDTWTFRALSPEPTPEECLRVSRALASALPLELREGARQHAFLGLLGLPTGARLDALQVEGDSDAARALRRELEPLRLDKVRDITTRDQGVPHTLYVQGKPWKSPFLGLLTRLACASMPADALHALDDGERYGLGGMSLKRRLVTSQSVERVGRTTRLYAPETYDIIVCLGAHPRPDTPLVRLMGLTPDRFSSARAQRQALVWCKGEGVFTTHLRRREEPA